MQAPQILLEWQSKDAPDHRRGYAWYYAGGVILLGFAAYGLFEKSWTTSLLALMIGGVYFLMRNVAPRNIKVRITGIGIQTDAKFTPWNQCGDFWILMPTVTNRAGTKPTPPELHISPRTMFQPEIVVFLENIDPVAVRETLLPFIPERPGMGERFLDYTARILKL